MEDGLDEPVAGGSTRRAAVATRVIHVKGVLDGGDISRLDELYATIRREEVTATNDATAEDQNHDRGQFLHPNLLGLRSSPHVTAYLHCADRITKALPGILAKVLAAMRHNDRQGLLCAAGVHGGHVRVCEYHDYSIGGAVALPKHCDSGSLVTMSVLLNGPDEFTGGAFTTLEADGSTTTHRNFQRGDGLVFVSEKWHSVQPVLSGNRRSLVTELWATNPWPWGRRGPSATTSGAVILRSVHVAAAADDEGESGSSSAGSDDDSDDDGRPCSPSSPGTVAAARAELTEIYGQYQQPGVPVPARRVERLLEQFAGVELEMVAEIRAKGERGELGGPASG